jgi:hypothetical protein
MNSPAALSQAFKFKAAALRDVVLEHLPAELKMGMMLLEAMPADTMTVAFHDHVAVPYSDRIKERDADFFLSDKVGTDPTLMALRAAWGDLPEDKQGEVWALLPLLCGISRKYISVSSGTA